MSMANRLQIKAPSLPTTNWPVDPVISVSFLMLVVFGLVMVASASSEISARQYGNPFAMFIRHGVYMAAALGAGAFAMSIPVSLWQRIDRLALLASAMLLVAVLVPGLGREVNGAARWIPLGFFNLQGSEFVKLLGAVFVAGYVVRNGEGIRTNWIEFTKPLAIMAALVVLLLGQPDFGAAVVIMSMALGVIFLAGAPMRFFLPMMLVVLAGGVFLVVEQPYRLARLAVFADPWQHQFGGGYQLTQALIAIGRGEWFGLGLGNSIQKLFFLPEAHTDFLFSIIVEELGVAGAVFVIGLFAALVTRGIWVGRRAEARGMYFHAYLAFGISLLLGVQAAINIGVNIGLLPTKGLTLPLVSYGGNSLIVSCMLVGMLLRIEYECRGEAVARRKGGARRG
ncbi:MAG: putative lipid II flippase FtsW [Pseudomonadales bacterium]|nr:putative lipid II flippase FtsW [Pseudomonadales bacterium]